MRVGFAIILTLIKHHRFQKQRQNNVVTEKTVEIETKQLRRQSQISSFRVTRPTLKFRVDSSRRLGNFVGIFWCDVDFYTSSKVFFRRAFCCLFTF